MDSRRSDIAIAGVSLGGLGVVRSRWLRLRYAGTSRSVPWIVLLTYLRFPDSDSRPMKTRTNQVRSPLGMICLALPPTSLGFWRRIGTHSTIVRQSFVEFS